MGGAARTQGPRRRSDAAGLTVTVAEFGLVVAATGGAFVVLWFWDDLAGPTRLALALAVAAVGLGAGRALAAPDGPPAGDGPAAGRLAGLALLVGTAGLAAGAAAVTTALGADDPRAGVVVGGIVAGTTSTLCWRNRADRPLALVGLAAGVGLTTPAAIELVGLRPAAWVVALTLWTTGAAVVVGALTGWLRPATTGIAVGGLGAVTGALVLNESATGTGDLAALVTAAVLVAVGIATGRPPVVVTATGALALLAVGNLVRFVRSPVTAVTLLLGGLVVALGAIGRLVPRGSGAAPAAAGSPPTDPPPADPPPGDPTLGDPSPADPAALVALLCANARSEDRPEVIETHMSWVVLVGARAYKLKKPILHLPVDYRSLADRRADCEAEVALNEVLAPGVYLGTGAVHRGPGAVLSLETPARPASGPVVDAVVVMRRLPRAAMLDARITRGDVPDEDLDALVGELCAFYRDAPRHPRTPAAHRAALHAQVATDARRATAPGLADGPAAGPAVVAALAEALHARIDDLADLDERAGLVVDGHGDLRPEHVVLGVGRPLVIDRITFDAALRTVDPLYDLALLAVECAMAGAPAVGERIVRGYRERAPDAAGDAIDALYRAIRALTRARLALEHLHPDTPAAAAAPWRSRATAELGIAAAQLGRAGTRR